MIAAHHPLLGVQEILRRAVRAGDPAAVADLLGGKGLPALGGDQDPADLVHRALSLPPYDPDLPRHLAPLVARLCIDLAGAPGGLSHPVEASEVREPASTYDAAVADPEPTSEGRPARSIAFDLFLLAGRLPRTPELFEGLVACHRSDIFSAPPVDDPRPTAEQLRRSLIWQQTDDRLEPHWLDLLARQGGRPGPVPEDVEADLVDGWIGLLWIPPTQADRDAVRPESIDRIVKGLRTIHDAVENSVDAAHLLRYALQELDEAYPRPQEFWAKELKPHLSGWPDLLIEAVTERWPLIQSDPVSSVVP
ncbi:MAG: hypothetical protein AAGN66_12565 [Acidobacteriota bacterium]